ncbi:hypothetical protein CAPTEDRAFT_225380 [Capitella teleta]|uniref:Aminopeptidase n=1 Tax=Capitella teleta TaxID=283909 RepID=R7TYJ5_CAPTE|nr:hypothetical protein CAPTEDRAFT_225380 [Capitella teleta]|eukprot:ELT98983.1 hypothetical protein CAPTEDRAFT_225380 [Capitella teleta]
MNLFWILLLLGTLVNVKSWSSDESLDRLPGHLRPFEYNITLQPFIYSSDDYSDGYSDLLHGSMYGQVLIKFICVEDTTRIVLHSVDLNIQTVFLTESGSNIEIQEVLFDEKRDFLYIVADSGLVQGHTYSVNITYYAKIVDKEGHGMFVHNYPQGNSTAPNGARRAFPCFDEPEYKARFDIVLIRRHHMTALSNAHLQYTVDVSRRFSYKTDGSSWMADHFVQTPMMSTYLVCFVICEYSHIEATTSSGTLVRVWTRPEVIHLAGPSLSVAVSAQEWFEEYTGLQDPMQKMDHFARNSSKYPFGAAMENWGLITYDENLLVSHEEWSDSKQKALSFKVIAHEIAHQWFGNLVTCHWWNDNWLTEGFATNFERLPLENIIVSNSSEMAFVYDLMHVQSYDASTNWKPVSWDFKSFKTTPRSEIFGQQYSKGALILRMVEQVLSPETFQRGIQVFSMNPKQQAAIEYISDSDGSPLIMKEKFATWLYQSGYPIIHVSWDPILETINLTQSHFNPNAQEHPASEFNYKWNIPISIGDISNSALLHYGADIWMDRQDAIIEDVNIAGDWIMINIGAHTLCRVHYDQETFGHIAQQLKVDHQVIHPESRAQFIGDAFTLAQYGVISAVNALEAIQYFGKEREGLPWIASHRQLQQWITWIQRHADTWPLFQGYLRKLVDPVYNEIGWHKPKYDLFDRVSVDQRYAVFCFGIRHGTHDDWEFAYERFQLLSTSTFARAKDEMKSLQKALACSSDKETLLRYIAVINDMPQSTHYYSLSYLLTSQDGRWAVWDMLKNTTGNISSYSYLDNVLSKYGFMIGFASDEDYAELMEYGPSLKYFQRAEYLTSEGRNWVTNNLQAIHEWLSDGEVNR